MSHLSDVSATTLKSLQNGAFRSPSGVRVLNSRFSATIALTDATTTVSGSTTAWEDVITRRSSPSYFPLYVLLRVFARRVAHLRAQVLTLILVICTTAIHLKLLTTHKYGLSFRQALGTSDGIGSAVAFVISIIVIWPVGALLLYHARVRRPLFPRAPPVAFCARSEADACSPRAAAAAQCDDNRAGMYTVRFRLAPVLEQRPGALRRVGGWLTLLCVGRFATRRTSRCSPERPRRTRSRMGTGGGICCTCSVVRRASRGSTFLRWPRRTSER